MLSERFPRYVEYDPAAPVWCVTPGEGRAIHRFFDTSPISPSGRYLAFTRLPYEGRAPVPGDAAEVVLVDLETGEERTLARTLGWDTQLGAGVQWGADDATLLYNDVAPDTWQPHGVVLDPHSGARRTLEGTVYMVSPDGRQALSPDLLRTGLTQAGYGVIAPPERMLPHRGAAADDGLWVTDLASGRRRLLVSLERIVEELGLPRTLEGRPAAYYGFHAKYDPTGRRIMFVGRAVAEGGGAAHRPCLVTCRADGSDLCLAVPPDVWARGGHHPNWCPDGEHLMMNLNLHGTGMLLVWARYDGTDLRPMTEALPGSGHPSLHPDGRHVITDAYTHEPLAYGDGTTPLRLIDLHAGTETVVARIRTAPDEAGPRNTWRVDPHPAWDRAFRRIVFNACPDGTRRVFVADLSALLERGRAGTWQSPSSTD